MGWISVETLCKQLDLAGLDVHKRFSGTSWDQLAIVPFFDAPEHITGLLCIGKDAAPEHQVYLPLTADPGLGFLSYVWPTWPHKYCRNTMFVTLDPLLAIQIHAQQSRTELPPWPVVLLRESPTAQTWARLIDHDRVFLCEEITSEVLTAAIEADAKIVKVAVNDSFVGETLPRLFRQWYGRQVDWQQALSQTTRLLPAGEQVKYLSDLPLSVVGKSRLGEHGSKFRKTRSSPVLGLATTFGKHALTVTGQGWVLPDSSPVSAVVPVLEDVVFNQTKHELSYSGLIYFEKHKVPFKVPASLAEGGTVQWVQEALITRRLGPAWIASNWHKRLWALTLAISTPRITLLDEHIGWDPARNLLRLPRCVLGRRGYVLPLPEQENALAGHSVPLPGLLSYGWLAKLAETKRHPTNTFWSVTLAALLAVMAPLYRESAISVALVGSGAQTQGLQAALALGCVPGQGNDWLQLCDTPQPGQALQQRIFTEQSWLLPASSVLASNLAVMQNWMVIRDDTPRLPLPTQLISDAGQLISNYLYDLSLQDFELPFRTGSETFEIKLYRDFSEWLLRQGGPSIGGWTTETKDNPIPRKWIFDRNDAGRRKHLESLLREIHLQGGSFAKPVSAKQTWLGIQSLNSELHQRGGIPLTTEVVSQALGDIWQGERRTPHGLGWIVSREWWEDIRARRTWGSMGE